MLDDKTVDTEFAALSQHMLHCISVKDALAHVYNNAEGSVRHAMHVVRPTCSMCHKRAARRLAML